MTLSCRHYRLLAAGSLAILLTTPLHAELGEGLTPMGAQQNPNAANTIPAWTGGLARKDVDEGGYSNPFADDEPRVIVTVDNLDDHREHLTPAQIAMFGKHPETFRMPVYPTRRSASYPEAVYAAVARNAEHARLTGTDSLSGATTGPAFPIPENGAQAIWNHKTKYGSTGMRLYANAAVVNQDGRYGLYRSRLNVLFSYGQIGVDPDDMDNMLQMFTRELLSPPQTAGIIVLGHQTLDQSKDRDQFWIYQPGERRVRRAPNAGYDNASSATEGITTADQNNIFNGPLDRYDWELRGTREIYIPYNAYALEDKSLAPDDIIRPGHINPDWTRYELHRVWVVEATVRDDASHLYARRTFYLDEDSWHIAVVDVYDEDGELFQLQEGHLFNAYDVPMVTATLEMVYPLQGNRYVAQNLDNDDPVVNFNHEVSAADMSPSALRRAGTR